MSKDFEARKADAYKAFAEAKAELEKLKKEVEDKEKKLEERREDILLHLMHEDKEAAPEGFAAEEGKKSPFLFTFIDEVKPEFLKKTKAIVVHYGEHMVGKEGDEDNVVVSYENTDDYDAVPIALAYALVKALIYGGIHNVPERAEAAEKLLDGVDVHSIANDVMKAATDGLAKAAVFNAIMNILFDDDDDEDEEGDNEDDDE